MAEAAKLDKVRVRRAFERAAAGYDAAAVLQNEICLRMQSRLDYIRHAPGTIVDAGTGTGNAIAGLLARYRGARVIALDLALGMAMRARGRRAGWKRLLDGARPRLAAVCGDIEQLPLAAGAADMIWSNLALQWVNALPRAFAEMHRVLAPGGLLLFSTFGPDTLKELRSAFSGVDGHTHVHDFIDMHDLGDMMVAQGFADPVMDMEVVTLTYEDARTLMRDLKAIGARNATPGRPGALGGRAALAAALRRYESFRRDGRLPASFEVIYGHAWKPQPRTGPGGRPVIDIKPQRD